jgi:uncharacterized protein HemX
VNCTEHCKRLQELESQLRLEIADLTQQLAATKDRGTSDCEVKQKAEQAAATSQGSVASLQMDLAKMTAQRDAAWKVQEHLYLYYPVHRSLERKTSMQGFF